MKFIKCNTALFARSLTVIAFHYKTFVHRHSLEHNTKCQAFGKHTNIYTRVCFISFEHSKNMNKLRDSSKNTQNQGGTMFLKKLNIKHQWTFIQL